MSVLRLYPLSTSTDKSLQLEQFIKKYKITKPNATTGVTHVKKDDIVLLDGCPCKVTKNRVSNVQTKGRLKGIAEVNGVGLLDQCHRRQSFMLFAESETGIGTFFWNPRIYSCRLVCSAIIEIHSFNQFL